MGLRVLPSVPPPMPDSSLASSMTPPPSWRGGVSTAGPGHLFRWRPPLRTPGQCLLGLAPCFLAPEPPLAQVCALPPPLWSLVNLTVGERPALVPLSCISQEPLTCCPGSQVAVRSPWPLVAQCAVSWKGVTLGSTECSTVPLESQGRGAASGSLWQSCPGDLVGVRI